MTRYLHFIVCFFLSSQVLAQSPLNQGEKAPEDGVFYTNTQAAQLIAERKAERQKLKVELESQKEQLNAACDGEKKIKDLYLDMEKERSKLLIDLKDKQIENLYKELEKESVDYSTWWFVGGATVGVVASLTIFFAATQVEKMPSLIGGN